MSTPAKLEEFVMATTAYRQLYLLQKLLHQPVVTKAELVDHFQVSARAVQRDFSDLRQFLSDEDVLYQLTYQPQLGGYTLHLDQSRLSQTAVLVLIKILLSSRALNPTELTQSVDSLLDLMPSADAQKIKRLINNEKRDYVPVAHRKPLLGRLWQLSNAITQHATLRLHYQRADHTYRDQTILPAALIFSEYYFYVIAFGNTFTGARFFRVDRIATCQRAPQALPNPRRSVADGQLRRVLHYMQPGQLTTITFEFWGVVEAALDRFPRHTVKAPRTQTHGTLIEIQAYDVGAKMWLLSQGTLVKVLSPASFVTAFRAELAQMMAHY